ncbi:MAG: hypothetical protein M1826_007039 [Phylliscum demangeonii]|nr:MAG: hypothetical protein M1826_007039 [Phylliscum demangeonii]
MARSWITAVQWAATAILTLVAIAAWVWHVVLALPVPWLGLLLAVIVPVINQLSLGHYYYHSGVQHRRTPTTTTITQPSKKRSTPLLAPLAGELLALSALLDAVLITLASAHLAGPTRACALSVRWRALFAAKDASSIRAIQNRLECCGFRSTQDQAWPFPDKEHAADACRRTFGRGASCAARWDRQERGMLALLLVVGACSLASKIAALVLVRCGFAAAAPHATAWDAAGWRQPPAAGDPGRDRGPRRALLASERYLDLVGDGGGEEEEGEEGVEGVVGAETRPATTVARPEEGARAAIDDDDDVVRDRPVWGA